VGPRASLEPAVRRKIPSAYRNSNPLIIQPQRSAVPLSYAGSSSVYKRTTDSLKNMFEVTFCAVFRTKQNSVSNQMFSEAP
jgi:hypothetical protein